MFGARGRRIEAMIHVSPRRRSAHIHQRFFRFLLAFSVLALTSGCETISCILAELFDEPPTAASQPGPISPLMADRIVVRKSKRSLELLHDGVAFERFPIALGRQPHGPKQEEGDGHTPEGIYHIDWRSMQTRYTRALHISYPDKHDREQARAMNVDAGGAIFVHGLPPDYG